MSPKGSAERRSSATSLTLSACAFPAYYVALSFVLSARRSTYTG